MPHRPFRFLHASDFRLDAVVQGLSEAPDHLRDALLDAPFIAARRAFDAALAERVEFVLLSGNVMQPEHCGPRGTAFLVEQFERLAAAKIDIYWAASETDRPEAWPTVVPLPERVHVFARDHVGEFLHPLDGPPLARIVGTSRGQDGRGSRALHPGEFVPQIPFDRQAAVGLFSISAACGEMDTEEMQAQGIHYWALGGHGERTTLFGASGTPQTADGRRQIGSEQSPLAASGPSTDYQLPSTHSTAHYPGTTQGRSPGEFGSRGCTLVSVDEAGRARLTPVATSALEWHEESLAVSAATTRDDLETMCAQQIRALAAHSKCDLLVTWIISGSGPLLTELRRGKLRGEILEWLRIEHGLSAPFVWTVGLEVAASASVPTALYEQETILGDYLRELREYDHDLARPLDVHSLLSGPAAESFAHSIAISDTATRQRVVHEAALLGIDLLSGEALEG